MATLTEVLGRRVRAVLTDARERTEQAMSHAVVAGAIALDRTLEDATTDTGYYRQLIHGGLPGRHDTGNMVSHIRQNGEAPKRESGYTEYAFGWFAGDFQEYFRDQDLGGQASDGSRGIIPPAHAMRAGARVAVSRFKLEVGGFLQ